MVDTAIRRMTLAGREAHRSERGANRIPAVWRGAVVFVRDEDSASGARAGVYIRVPRLVGEQTLGPLPVVGTVPVVDDRVLVVAVEGRRDQLMILNPPEGVPDDLLDRLDTVETKALDLRTDVDALDQALQQVLPRLDDVEGVADDAVTAAGQAQSSADSARQAADTAQQSADAAHAALDDHVTGPFADVDQRSTANATAIANLPGIEVDTSAGTRVMIGGHTIHYDSGWRDISNLLSEQWEPDPGAANQPGLYIRRENSLVSMSFRLMVADDPLTSNPASNTADNRLLQSTINPSWRPLPVAGSAGYILRWGTKEWVDVSWHFVSNPRLLIWNDPAGPWEPGESLRGAIQYAADGGYPTSLIGTPA